MGLLLLGAERFQKLGEGTKRGSYAARKLDEAAWMKADAEKIADVTFTGIVYTASDVQRAIDAFVQSKVDYVLAIYLSWAEDFPLDPLSARYAALPRAVRPQNARPHRSQGHPRRR